MFRFLMVEASQVTVRSHGRSRPDFFTGKAAVDGETRASMLHGTCRGHGDGMYAEEIRGNTGSPSGDRGRDQPATRESQAGRMGWRRGSKYRGSRVQRKYQPPRLRQCPCGNSGSLLPHPQLRFQSNRSTLRTSVEGPTLSVHDRYAQRPVNPGCRDGAAASPYRFAPECRVQRPYCLDTKKATGRTLWCGVVRKCRHR